MTGEPGTAIFVLAADGHTEEELKVRFRRMRQREAKLMGGANPPPKPQPPSRVSKPLRTTPPEQDAQPNPNSNPNPPTF